MQIDTKQWRYYDFGPKVVPPLLCLPTTAGTADDCDKQIMSLSMKPLAAMVKIRPVIHPTTFEKNVSAKRKVSIFFDNTTNADVSGKMPYKDIIFLRTLCIE
ncbi:hypothetical protein ACFX12_033929 [Malus domestica]